MGAPSSSATLPLLQGEAHGKAKEDSAKEGRQEAQIEEGDAQCVGHSRLRRRRCEYQRESQEAALGRGRSFPARDVVFLTAAAVP